MKPVAPTRRGLLLSGAAALAAPASLRAQDGPVRLGTLTPLTGAGSLYGVAMRNAVLALVEQVNTAGGVLGRPVSVVPADSETDPDRARLAARRLIEEDGVQAIIGTWSSSVTAAVAPLAWATGVMLFTVSGADALTRLPHRGLIARTQPNSKLQITIAGAFMRRQGAQRMAWIGPRSSFARSSIDILGDIANAAGLAHDSLVYETGQNTYRAEVDAILRGNPDFIILGGYPADSALVLSDLQDVGYAGRIVGPSYAINATVIEAMPDSSLAGVLTWEATPAVDSGAYARLQALLGVDEVDPYTAQTHDQAALACLSMAASGQPTGAGMRDGLRAVSQGGGRAVDNAVDGLAALSDGPIDYAGASGPCDFDAIGDITATQLLFRRIEDGAPVDVERVAGTIQGAADRL